MSLTPRQFGDCLVELLPRLMKEISRYENNYVTSGKITCQQFLVLDQLAQRDAWKMNELTSVMQTSFSTTTGMISRLVNHGLAKRSHGESDRRTVWVSITPKGRRIIKEVFSQKKEGIVQVFKRLTAEERRLYLEIIQKLVDNLSSAKGE